MSNVNLLANVQYTPSLGANPINVSVGTSNITYKSVVSGTIEIPLNASELFTGTIPTEALLANEGGFLISKPEFKAAPLKDVPLKAPVFPFVGSQSLLLIIKNRNSTDIGITMNNSTSDGYSLFQLSAGGTAMFVNPVNASDLFSSPVLVQFKLLASQDIAAGYVDYWVFTSETLVP